jgi:glutamate dehydrogenase
VTSSSLEVLAGLALTDEEFDRWLVVGADGAVPEFRRRYVEEILQVVRAKAKAEFELLWRLHAETREPFSTLSDRLSDKINELTAAVAGSTLFASVQLRRNLLAMHIPKLLRQEVGLDRLLERIPESYQRAICARTLASSFVYRFGINPGYEDYRQYVEELGQAKPVKK